MSYQVDHPELKKNIRHRRYREQREKREWNQALLNRGIKILVEILRDHGATPENIKGFYKSLGECTSAYYTTPIEKACDAVLSKSELVPLEYYWRGIVAGMSEVRSYKPDRMHKGWVWSPVREKLAERESSVGNRMRSEIGKRLPVYMGAGPAPEGQLKVPTSYEKQVRTLGKREMNGRFILSAELVDEVGEFKLFQISYVSRGDSAASNTLQWGYVATYNDDHHAFAQSPTRAMSAAKTNMVKAATAKLAR